MKEGWEYKKLEEVGRVITGSTPSTKSPENYSSKDVCFVKPSDLPKDGVGLVIDTEFHISKKAYNNSRKLPKGSVLTTCIGIVGKVAILQVDATCNQQINAIIPDATISSHFLAYSILSKRDYLEKRANAPVVPIINKKDFSSTVIAVPSLSEQQHIVEELDLLSSIIEKKKVQLNELDNLAQSLFYEMFGDPIMNEKGWKVKKLGEVGKFINGDRGKNYPSQKDFVDNGIPFINAGHIKKNHVDMETMNYISREKFEKLGSGKIQDGDILFCLRGSLGKKAIVKNLTEGAIASSLVIIRVVDANINYISFYLESDAVKKEILKNNNGSSQPNLSAKSVASFHVPVPPLELQQRFAEKVESIERQKELIKKSIKEVETLFNSRMDYYFN